MQAKGDSAAQATRNTQNSFFMTQPDLANFAAAGHTPGKSHGPGPRTVAQTFRPNKAPLLTPGHQRVMNLNNSQAIAPITP